MVYRFSFLGVLYDPWRRPDTIFKALKILRDKNPGLAAKIRFDLVGVEEEKYSALANEMGVGDIVTCKPRVDYFTSMRIMKESAVLVHIGFITDKHPEDIHISGKLFEYVGAGQFRPWRYHNHWAGRRFYPKRQRSGVRLSRPAKYS